MNALMDMYGGLNFTVLGFPCNQFGLQAPEENHETLNVLQYVRPGGGFLPKFPIFSRIEVNGADENPLYAFLKKCDIIPGNSAVCQPCHWRHQEALLVSH